MRKQYTAPIAILIALLTYSCSQSPRPAEAQSAAAPAPRWGIVIHTGAGNFTLSGIAERKDAMQAAIVILEDSPLFNAGKARSSRTKGPTSSTPRSWTAAP